MIRGAHAIIDLAALSHNFQRVKQLAPNSKVMAVIKADAYGHGMLQVAKTLSDADGFAVACLAEARVLREAGITQAITVLQGFRDADELQAMISQRLRPVIHQHWQLELLERLAQGELEIWFKVNTGMGRLGFALEQAGDIWSRLQACKHVSHCGLMSHFANADEPDHALNSQQLQCFQQLAQEFAAETTLANSAGLIAFDQAQGDWVRPGIMLYGSSPLIGQTAAELELKPVMQLKSRIIAINHLSKGQPVGYGSNWLCPQDMPVGVVGIGYGDGYPRHARSGTPVWIAGKPSQLLGRVSMDMITVDLRNIEQAQIGDEVELWGNTLSVDEVAQHADTISYELLCNMKACRTS
ncbi:MAG TPA: alanine racemase [Gammaproteobacteria bacterium]